MPRLNDEVRSPITENERQYVTTILQHRLFKKHGQQRTVSRIAELLQFLSDETIEGRKLSVEQVAKTLYGDAKKTAQVAENRHRLTKALTDYNIAVGPEIVLSVPSGGLLYVAYRRTSSDDATRASVASPPFEPWNDLEQKHGIPPSALRALLKRACEAQGMDEHDLNLLTAKFIDAIFRGNQWFTKKQRARAFEALFERLDTRNADLSSSLTYSNMRLFLQELGIHKLMLDPLLSKPDAKDNLVLRLPFAGAASDASGAELETSFKQIIERPDEVHEGVYGEGARYAIPEHRLKSSEASLIYVVLEPNGGHSTAHQHSGDELMYVIQGCVQVHLGDCGMEVELDAGSYLHFYSEQRHSAHNYAAQEAHLLVIRLYQTGSNGSDRYRQSLGSVLRKALAKYPPAAQLFGPSVWEWMLEASAPRMLPEFLTNVPSEVLNSHGLVRLLSMRTNLDRARKEKILKTLNRKDGRYNNVPALLWAIATNQRHVEATEIPKIADVFSVFELLAYGFLFPSIPGHVVVKRHQKPSHWAALREIVERFKIRKPIPVESVNYRLPRRTLACSDVSVARLRLYKGVTGPDNHHPGSELLIPLEGKVAVRIYEGKRVARQLTLTARQHIAHHTSQKPHELLALEDAQVLVIRFYGEGSTF